MKSLYPNLLKLKIIFLAILLAVSLSGCTGGYSNTQGNPYNSPWVLTETSKQVESKQQSDQPNMDWRTPKQGRQAMSELEQQTLDRENRGIFSMSPNQTGHYKNQQKNVPVGQVLNKKKVSVAILLPLSGRHQALGQSMLQSSQMAIFDIGAKNFNLIPIDTKGNTSGAISAATKAIGQKVDLIIGPIFSGNLKAIKPVVQPSGIPIIAFTTDWTLAGRNTYVMGFLPFAQVERVANYSRSKGYNRYGVLAPKNEYSDVVIRTLSGNLRRHGEVIADSRYFSPMQKNMHNLVKDYVISNPNNVNALMMPMGGADLKSVSSYMSYYDMNRKKSIKLLGTGLWEDPSLAKESGLHGAWFAAPDPTLRRDFERRYKKNYDAAPVRLASLSYDATALAAILAGGNGQPYNPRNITNIRGFSGIDGIFRFRPDGMVERGLAVLEVRPNGLKVIDPAPRAFVSGS